MQSGDVLILNAMSMSTYGTISSPVGAILEIDFSWNSNSLIACGANQIKFIGIDGTSTWSINVRSPLFSCKLNKADGVGFSFSNDEIAWYQYNTNTVLASDKTGSFR